MFNGVVAYSLPRESQGVQGGGTCKAANGDYFIHEMSVVAPLAPSNIIIHTFSLLRLKYL